MKRSTGHILTTHTGSLPRPPELLEALQRRDRGDGDSGGLDGQVRDAVAHNVRRQADAGVSVVNDGEAGKIGYATYVKERLDGFGGEGALSGVPADMAEFPEYAQRVMSGMDFALPACVGPASYRDTDAVRADIGNLEAALEGADVEDAFMSAASPGVIAVFLQNQYYAGHDEYVGGRTSARSSRRPAVRPGSTAMATAPRRSLPPSASRACTRRSERRSSSRAASGVW